MSTSRTQLEDDDLDDLDDIVDQFDPVLPTKPPPAAPAPPTTDPFPPPSSSTSHHAPVPSPLPDDFARELAEGMESLMRELGAVNGATTSPATRRAWEQMLTAGMDGVDPIPDSAQAPQPPAPPAVSESNEDAFQKSIRQAMEKLRDSDSTLTSDAAAPDTAALESLLSQIGGSAAGGEGEDEEINGMLELMMQQLMSKEVLYEPLKELQDKFPGYLSDNAASISPEDKTRYTEQLNRVTKIVAAFEDPAYSDDDPQKGIHIVALMNEMQSFGSPPAAIMGDLPPGFDLGADGLPKIPDGCTIC